MGRVRPIRSRRFFLRCQDGAGGRQGGPRGAGAAADPHRPCAQRNMVLLFFFGLLFFGGWGAKWFPVRFNLGLVFFSPASRGRGRPICFLFFSGFRGRGPRPGHFFLGRAWKGSEMDTRSRSNWCPSYPLFWLEDSVPLLK